jgi:hypothetical protein
MAINSDTDIAIAIEKLGKKPESFGLTQSIPPHNITHWEGGDKQPTDAEINKGWSDYKAAQAAVKYKTDRTTNGSTTYDTVGNQLDMLYADLVAGKLDATGTWAKHIKAVKDANPKP